MPPSTIAETPGSGRVHGKVALVTGAASGIGAACARLLASEGAKVVLADLNHEQAARLAADFGPSGERTLCLHHDVADEESWGGVTQTESSLDVEAAPNWAGLTGLHAERSCIPLGKPAYWPVLGRAVFRPDKKRRGKSRPCGRI